MIAIIDYGAGNLFSVKNALDHLGYPSVITRSAVEIKNADRLILPGVGAFPDAMKLLRQSKLVEVIKEEAVKKPLLGICLGMQMLFEKSFEFEETEGLGLIPGEVISMDAPHLKIPNIGWSALMNTNPCALSEGIKDGDMVYFVHSYKASTPSAYLSLHAEYGGVVPGLVFRDRVFGTQFHPEKSGTIGLRILKNFGEMK